MDNYFRIKNFLIEEANKPYLSSYKNTLLNYVDSNTFNYQLDTIVNDKCYSVFFLMDLFYDYFKSFNPMNKNRWLENIYKYLINTSFPNKYYDGFDKGFADLYLLYLNSLRLFIEIEGENDTTNCCSKYPICFLTPNEILSLNYPKEYLTFKKAFSDRYIYELMLLDTALNNHNTLDHVIGVNYLSLYIGRQLSQLGLPVNLEIVVGAGLGHDIGKYGVLDKDSKKVPYYHYYYTEEWFNGLGLEKTGHIATNHSVWDLELTALPLESLLLIYADFRVKNRLVKDNYEMHIYSLEEAFEVILNKLDNVDDLKKKRYERVYKKLKDFEDYIIGIGVDISLNGKLKNIEKKPYSLMDSKDVIHNLKYLSIEHNIKLMSVIMDDYSFNHLLDRARGENNWRNLRLYLQIFREYSNYLAQKQKLTALHFLQDLLLHREEDIRKEAADLIGILIGLFDEEYRKEVPDTIGMEKPQFSSEVILDDLLKSLLYPDHKIADSQREWLYNLKIIIQSLFETAPKELHLKYFDVLANYYCCANDISSVAQFYLSQTIKYINLDILDEKRLSVLFEYIFVQLESNDIEIRLSTLDIINEMLVKMNDDVILVAFMRNWLLNNLDKSSSTAEDYLKFNIGKSVALSHDFLANIYDNYTQDKNSTSEVFLENLKTATDWMKKKVNIDILYDYVTKNPSSKGLHAAMHLCNLLKVSAIERVRNYAGATLLNIFPYLYKEEKNDVAIELLRALEMENYQFTKYIPEYLGQLILLLPPTEFDELIDDFEYKIKTSSTQVIILLLSTVGVIIENYFKVDLMENEEKRNQRLSRLLGLLLISMASYDNEIKIEAFRVISTRLFKSNITSLEDKYKIFKRIAKKILTMLNNKMDDDFLFYNNTSSLTHIYHFISDYEFQRGSLSFDNNRMIAFFPGTFDPFSLSHREIAKEIENNGFEVYLAVDEFSWSKRTEPHMIRREIIQMSIAGEEYIYLFPSEIPINLNNIKDLESLRKSFNGREVYIVVGTDVLINASAYSNSGPILDFSHIIFDRKVSTDKDDNDNETELIKRIDNIRGNVLRLSLPPQYEDISSTKIRDNIDLNRDISKIIDPLAQEYIYKKGLYLKGPLYKTLLQTKKISVEVSRNLDQVTINYLLNTFGDKVNLDELLNLRNKPSYRILMLKDKQNSKLLGFSAFYWVRHSMLYEEFSDINITEYIRLNATGRTLLIAGLIAKDNDERSMETILNETLSIAINRDYNFCLFNDSISNHQDNIVEELVMSQGFVDTNYKINNHRMFIVNMNNPCTLNFDLGSILKPPFNTDEKIQKVIQESRKKLRCAISKLYPGQLLLTYHRDMIYSKLVQKITSINNVPSVESEIRQLGEYMCVPFGSILNNSIIPNTVTKTLHTEKIYKPNIKDFIVGSSPNHLPIDNQVNIIKSFNRSVILVDDLLNKGYRLSTINPLFKKFNLNIKTLMVGILSGRGKEFAEINNLPVDYAYYVPNLRLWFNEGSLYPFIGGDMVEQDGNSLRTTLIPSINMILPYVSPSFIKNTTKDALYNLSEVCLINAYNIFNAIEESYQQANEKNLNIKGLGEVILLPRHPDINRNMNIEGNIKPSRYIEMDMEYLNRLQDAIKGIGGVL